MAQMIKGLLQNIVATKIVLCMLAEQVAGSQQIFVHYLLDCMALLMQFPLKSLGILFLVMGEAWKGRGELWYSIIFYCSVFILMLCRVAVNDRE